MNISQGSLVIVGANTPECKVYWKGVEVQGVVALSTTFDEDDHRVVIKVAEDPVLAEMKAAGIEIRRV